MNKSHRYTAQMWLQRRAGREVGKTCLALIVLALCMASLPAPARAGVWDMNPPLPDNDPQWAKVGTLWEGHYGGRNLDELISTLNPLLEKYPDRIEPRLWLARAHHLHARYHRRDREYHYEKAEGYAAKACRLDPKNTLALRALVDTLFHSRDRDYIMANYGNLIRSCAPLPVGEALPDLDDLAGWNEFKALWAARGDLYKAQQAVLLVNNLAAANPGNTLVQIWAARANYYAGEWYTSLGEHRSKAMPYYKKGISFAGKAMALEPLNVCANFWYQVNLARSIQDKWLIVKARYLKSLLTPLLFTCRENSQYYFDTPMLTLGGMITNGGWVTEKGMSLAGVSFDLDMNAIELAEILNPDFYFIPYTRADLLAYKGHYKEAHAILDSLLKKNPDSTPLIPENRTFLRFAKTLHDQIEKKQARKRIFLVSWLWRDPLENETPH
jgi:tetratricopeptide (TPR) repeat protein